MIKITIVNNEEREFNLKSPQSALRFIYMMKAKGYIISGIIYDDTWEMEWLERRLPKCLMK